MKTIVKNLLVFASGAAIGATVSGLYFKKKYEKRATEDAKSVRDMLTKRAKYNTVEQEEPEEVTSDKPVIGNKTDLMTYYEEKKKNWEPTPYDSMYHSKNEPEKKKEKKESKTKVDIVDPREYPDDDGFEAIREPYVITPEEFGMLEGYDQLDLHYYMDGVLTELSGELIDDIDTTVGYDCLERIGEYEADVVHVRNEVMGIDFVISKDLRTYQEVVGKS